MLRLTFNINIFCPEIDSVGSLKTGFRELRMCIKKEVSDNIKISEFLKALVCEGLLV